MLFGRRFPFYTKLVYHYDSQAGLLSGLYQGAVLCFLAVVARKIGSSDFQIALITSALFWGVLFSILWAHLSSSRRKMPFFFWPTFIARGLMLLMFFVTGSFFYCFIVLLSYILEGVGAPAYGGIMKEVYPEEKRAEAMGYVRMFVYGAVMVSTLVFGFLLDHFGKESFRFLFPLGSLFGMGAVLFFRRIRIRREKISPKRRFQPFTLSADPFKKKRFLFLELSIFLAGFGCLLAMPAYVILLVDYLKLSNSIIGILTFVFSFFSLIGYYFYGRYIGKKLLSALMVSFLLVSFIFLLYVFKSLPLLFLAATLNGIATPAWDLGSYNYIVGIAEKKEVQNFAGMHFTLMGVRGVIGPFVGVKLLQVIGMERTFLVSFTLAIVGFFVLLKLKNVQNNLPG